LLEARFSSEERMIGLWHVRRDISNAGSYLDARISRPSH
jgi:hypothetical protein